MKISIVTITFNNFEELIKTIDSTKDIENIENVVVNGGSCHKTKAFLEKEFQGIYLTENDDGISDAFNKGIKLATGDLIVFLNSGDYLIEKSYYELAIKEFLENPDLDYIYSDIIFFDGLMGKTLFEFKNKSLGRGSPYFHQTFIMKTKKIKELGCFSKDYKVAMDFDLFVRVRKHRLNGKYIAVPSVLMDGRGISVSNEFKGILECERSLKTNGLYTLENRLGLMTRKLFYFIRVFINKIFGELTLKKIKKQKYQ